MLSYREALVNLFDSPQKHTYGREWDTSKPTIAVVLDEFSTQCFSGVANIVPIGLQDIEKALDYFKPDLLLCESAWSGNNFTWRYRFARTSGPDSKVEELVSAARERGIPSAFWNKEDPPHFDEFKETAALFDFIFTTEASVVPRYRALTGRDNISVLPFAAAPDIHSPRRVEGYRSGQVAFAGQYFVHKFPERRAQMDYLFPAASEFNFDIFSREQGGDPNYRFPERYEEKIKGSLPYHEMVLAYRRYKLFLNVNSVPQSESMCARRIFELSACKTLVLSSPSNAISRFYADGEVLQASDQKEAVELIGSAVNDQTFFERTAHRAWRVTMRRHTYDDRLKYILAVVTRDQDQASTSEGHADYDSSGPLQFSYVACLDIGNDQDVEPLLAEIEAQSVRPSGVHICSSQGGWEATRAAERLVAGHGWPLADRDRMDEVFSVSFSTAMSYAPAYAEDLYLAARQQPEAFVGKTELHDGTAVPGRPTESSSRGLLRGTIAARRLGDLLSLYGPLSDDDGAIELPVDGYAADKFNCIPRGSRVLDDEDWKI
ncbi:CgeB family protein [Zhihengliuella halotolerans]|uniref:CgeB family protein n=1 Tax=Zhihengliuella halotolerans TaxID=370736 RepID=UPI000C80D7C3|nr:glycosyltransferase [Zhihengliuella halotolerans]